MLRDTDQSRIHPKLVKLTEFGNILFTCNSTTKPTWYFSEGPIPVNARVDNDGNLSIQKAQIFNQGTLECEGITENDEIFRSYAEIVVRGKFYYNHNIISQIILEE